MSILILLTSLFFLSYATVIIQNGGNTIEMTYYLHSNNITKEEIFYQNTQYTAAAPFADTYYTSIVCMSMQNNKTMVKGDRGNYYQIVEKADNTKMSAHIMYVEATSTKEIRTMSNCTWNQPPQLTLLANQKLWMQAKAEKGIEGTGIIRGERSGMKCWARFSQL